MIYHRKLLILKRLNRLMKLKRTRMPYFIGEQSLNPPQSKDENQQYVEPVIDIPFELIQIMSPKQRKQLSMAYPTLPQYMFMSSKQKIKYFQDKDKEYQRRLQSERQRVSKTKKIVKFSKKFQVKPFAQSQKVGLINQTNSFQDSYKPEHYS